MNEPIFEESATDPTPSYSQDVGEQVRRNPGTALLIALGAGMVIALLVRALRPEPTPRQRLARLVEDLESRLRDVAEPAVRKAGSFAREGASVLHDGLQNGEAGIERLLRDAGKRARGFFS